MTTLPPDRDAIQAELARLDAERAALLARLEGAGPPKPAPKRDKLRLTKSSVAALPIPGDKHRIVWDRDLVGFGVRLSPHGLKTYFLQVRTKTGRGIKVTLGRASRITAEQAREAARKHLAAVDLGGDPALEIKQARQAERERKLAPTLAALWADLERNPMTRRDAEAEPLRPKSLAAYRSWWRLHLEPRLGRLKVADLTTDRVEALQRELSASARRSTANRVLAVLSRLMSRAKELRLIAANPCQDVKRYKEHGRERLLDDAELGALLNHLAGSEDLEARVLEFLLATGGRKGEVLAMRWQDLNGGSWWTVPAEVSKSRKVVRRPLNAAARDVLARLNRRHGDDLVFGVTPSRLGKWWLQVRADLGLADVKIHDLRHCAASSAINSGVPLAAVSKLLGHGAHSAAMTARYSHVLDTELARASDAVAERLRALRDAEPAGRA
jgi:integrase